MTKAKVAETELKSEPAPTGNSRELSRDKRVLHISPDAMGETTFKEED